jgi:hypothetical protein
MLHEGYLAEIELDEDAGLLRGIVVNACHQTFWFRGRTIEELRNAFDDGHPRDSHRWTWSQPRRSSGNGGCVFLNRKRLSLCIH